MLTKTNWINLCYKYFRLNLKSCLFSIYQSNHWKPLNLYLPKSGLLKKIDKITLCLVLFHLGFIN